MTERSRRTTYWTILLLLLLPTAGTGFLELFTGGPSATVKTLQLLGYPLYLMKIMGLAKILGAAALLTRRSALFSEWAYAGFAFLFLGATASHLLAHDASHAPIPLSFFVLLVAARKLDHRLARST